MSDSHEELGRTYDDESRTVGTCDFQYPREDGDDLSNREVRLAVAEVIGRLLQWCLRGSTDQNVRLRVLTVARYFDDSIRAIGESTAGAATGGKFKQSISRLRVQFQDEFGVGPVGGGRSNAARQAMAEAYRKRRAKELQP